MTAHPTNQFPPVDSAATALPNLEPVAQHAASPPTGTELASLLILCCNQLAYTRLCLESVLRHTRYP